MYHVSFSNRMLLSYRKEYLGFKKNKSCENYDEANSLETEIWYLEVQTWTTRNEIEKSGSYKYCLIGKKGMSSSVLFTKALMLQLLAVLKNLNGLYFADVFLIFWRLQA